MKGPFAIVLAVASGIVGASWVGAQDPDRQAEAPKLSLFPVGYLDHDALSDSLKRLTRDYPEAVRLASLAKSREGREVWVVSVGREVKGTGARPSVLVVANLEADHAVGTQVALGLIERLAGDRDPAVARLLEGRTVHVVPRLNPDGAERLLKKSPRMDLRGNLAAIDRDRDGKAGEDGPNDLDGDGLALAMRARDARASLVPDAKDPRILRKADPAKGERAVFSESTEGIDDDADGAIDEDPPGGVNLNRNWPADWQPDHVQAGAGDFPLSWPETRAVAAFLLDHPNVAGVQAFHNAAGMILRGPGHPSRQAAYPRGDDRVAEEIGATGARMIPFYRNLVIHKDLYSVHGGFIGWTYEHLGIFSFTNELWNADQMLGTPAPAGSTGPTIARAAGLDREEAQLFANDKLLFGATFREWKPAKHPTYGDIEIGGFVKQSQRVPPTFMIEELCHRNAAFVLYHADQMPRLEFGEVEVKPLGGEVFAVTATVRNTRSIPSVAQQAAAHNIGLPDVLGLEGAGLAVLGGGRLVDPYTGEVEASERDPAHLRLIGGVPGHGSIRVRWYVKGSGEATLKHASQKGGTITKSVPVH